MKKTRVSKDAMMFVSKEKEKAFFAGVMKHKEAKIAYNEAEALINFVMQLQQIMKKKKLTYYAIAKKAGMHHEVLARILNGSKNAEVSTLSKIAYGVGAKLSITLIIPKKS